MPRRLENVLAIFNGDPSLQKLRGELEAQTRLLNRVQRLLPADLAPHCRAARIDDRRRLVLVTDNPVWASRLRYTAAELLVGLRSQSGERLHGIQTVVQPQGQAKPSRRTAVRSPRAAGVVMECANNAPDQALGAALRRLANAIVREPSDK